MHTYLLAKQVWRIDFDGHGVLQFLDQGERWSAGLNLPRIAQRRQSEKEEKQEPAWKAACKKRNLATSFRGHQSMCTSIWIIYHDARYTKLVAGLVQENLGRKLIMAKMWFFKFNPRTINTWPKKRPNFVCFESQNSQFFRGNRFPMWCGT